MKSLFEQVCPRLECLCIFSDYPVPEKSMMLIGSLLRPAFHSLVVFSGRVLVCSRADGTADKDVDVLLKVLKWDAFGDDESEEGVNGAEESEESEEKKDEEKAEKKGEERVEEKKPAEEKAKPEEKKPAEEEKAEQEKKEVEKPEEEKGVPDLEVKNNGIEIRMWMKCEEGSCVLDVERSGSYDSFSDLCDCETSVQLEHNGKRYLLPTPLRIDHETLKKEAIHVSLLALLDG